MYVLCYTDSSVGDTQVRVAAQGDSILGLVQVAMTTTCGIDKYMEDGTKMLDKD